MTVEELEQKLKNIRDKQSIINLSVNDVIIDDFHVTESLGVVYLSNLREASYEPKNVMKVVG